MVPAFGEKKSQSKQNKLMKDAHIFTVKNPSTSNVLEVNCGKLMERLHPIPGDLHDNGARPCWCMFHTTREPNKQPFLMVHHHGSDDIACILSIIIDI